MGSATRRKCRPDAQGRDEARFQWEKIVAEIAKCERPDGREGLTFAEIRELCQGIGECRLRNLLREAVRQGRAIAQREPAINIVGELTMVVTYRPIK